MNRNLILFVFLFAFFFCTGISRLHAQEIHYIVENDSVINSFLNEVEPDSIESYIQFLQDKVTRFMIAPNHRAVAESVRQKFIALGADEAYLDSALCTTVINYQNIVFDTITWQYNVVAKINGLDSNYLVMGAHYDNVVAPAGDPMIYAPGADDNASGVAAAFECLRIMKEKNYTPLHNIEFVAFAAEELMYFGNSGAQFFVDHAIEAGKNIDLMINNDMIAYTASKNWVITLSNYIGSEYFTTMAQQITEDYTMLDLYLLSPGNQGGADCKYFYEAGVPCIYFMEKDFNPYYHSNNDLIENIDMDYCAEVAKISLGVLLATDDTTTTHIAESRKSSLKVYPNPSYGYIILSGLNNDEPVNYFISDINGRILKPGKLLGGSEEKIMLDNFKNGFYTINYIGKNFAGHAKFILSR